MALVLTLLGFVDLGLVYPGANARASFIIYRAVANRYQTF